MRLNSQLILVTCLSQLAAVEGQFSNWQDSQVNTSMCLWYQPRAALVRDTVYLDGGSIWWSPGLANGQIGKPVNNGNFQGYILSYNLSESFSTGTNVTGIMLKYMISKARGGIANGISPEPNYYDGGMLANDAEFFLYGGAVFRHDLLYELPSADAVLGYRRYAYGPEKPLWQKGFSSSHLNGGVTGYVAYGAAVSAPSENKAWYFSGLTSPTQGLITQHSGVNDSTRAEKISNTLIRLDMETQLEQKWSNMTLPEKIRGRSNSEVVWVPVGKQGILVVLGGVVYPEWAADGHKSENETPSKPESQDFMRVIDIYDVASEEWYQQPTQGGPGTKARGCAVVAPASDFSSFNIYYYGGFDGIHPKREFSDEVWVLSLPSFTWTLINKGRPIHARSGHKCFMPYPDQMMVFGGYTPMNGTSLTCLDQGPIVLFNLTSGQWMESYSPSQYADYGVHDSIAKIVGGDASGGATVTSPLSSGWSTSALKDIFATPYDKKKITHYWPYTNSLAASPTPSADHSESKKSPTLRTLLPAIILPVIFVLGLAIAFWCLCVRRKRRTPYSAAGSTAVDSSSRNVMTWPRGPMGSKHLTLTGSHATINTGLSNSGETTRTAGPEASSNVPVVHYEMADTQISELCGTSSVAELHGTGFIPVSPATRHAGLFGSDASFSSNRSQQGRWAADNVSLGSCRTYNPSKDRHWADSPMAEPLVNMYTRTSAGGLSGIQEFEQAVHEDADMNSPVSPLIASERLYGEVMSPNSMVSSLQRTMSEEDKLGRFNDFR